MHKRQDYEPAHDGWKWCIEGNSDVGALHRDVVALQLAINNVQQWQQAEDWRLSRQLVSRSIEGSLDMGMFRIVYVEWYGKASRWNISSEDYGVFFIFSLKLTLSMQIAGFSVRLSSSLLWVQMYKLGVSHVESAVSRDSEFDLRNSFLNPSTPAIVRQLSDSEDPIGGSIYDPAYYSSLFEIVQDNGCSYEGPNQNREGDSSSNAESCRLQLSIGRSSRVTTLVTFSVSIACSLMLVAYPA
ncbi:hypothetical protein Ancab_000003 [Ancistrocladus abbreviatus]